jgi:predicted phage-related endonuclease
MVWGQDTEPDCKSAWEAHTGQFIAPCGLYDHPEIDNFAATPDGLIGSDGLIECKCPTSPTFTGWLLAGVVPEQHMPQMAAQLLCTGRKWVEFVAYDPRVKDPTLRLFVRRFEPTTEYLGKVEEAAMQFLAEVDSMWEQLTTRAA